MGTVWLHIGDPFDGPRFGPPLHLKGAEKDPGIFQDLVSVIEDVFKIIGTQPATAWERSAEKAPPPKINGRQVKLNLRLFSNELEEFLVMRACLPFPAWPLGGWVVYEGWKRTGEGAWTPLPAEELEKFW